MKKLLLVLAIGAFVACNDSGSKEGEASDSPAIQEQAPVTPDSPAVVTPDSPAVVTPDSPMAK